MTDKLLDKETFTIEDAFAAAVLRDFDSIPKRPLPPYSSRFLKKMEKLLRKERRFYFPYTNTVGKRVVAAAVAICIAFGTSLSFSAVRDAVAGFFTDIYESFTRLTVAEEQAGGDLKEIIEEVYIIDPVPEGYYLRDATHGVGTNVYYWANTDGEKIELYQLAGATSSSLIDTEDNPYKEIRREDFEGIYLIDGNYQTLAWVYDGYSFRLVCPTDISENELIEMAKSIKVFS